MQRAFSVAASFPWVIIGVLVSGMIREIRTVSLYVPGFQLCELEEFVYVASTF